MKRKSIKIAPWMAAALCLALVPAAKAKDDTNTPKGSMTQESSSEMKSNQAAPVKANKASSIIGMDVRNPQNEHLGHIKELVIDWKTEQVSYAVINTGPKMVLDVNEKLLAVPLSALTVSSDQKHLILNADKAKVQAAAGFDKNNWPSVSNPSWGAEPVWQQQGTTKPGASDEPGKEPGATTKPGTSPDPAHDMSPGQEPPSPPEMDTEPKSDPGQDSNQDSDPDGT